jgi:Na+-transporting NADH:ubiquinone oxidoreductase subunit NqrB
MTLKSEKEIRQVVQIGIATALYLWGFPALAIVMVVLILPWTPAYRVAAYLGCVVLEVKAKRTVKRAMRKLSDEPVHAT